MKLWSRGLGTTELLMDFREYTIEKDPQTGNILVYGTIKDPVNWEFKMTLEPDDIPGFIKMMLNLSVLKMGVANAHKYIDYLTNRERFDPVDSKEMEKKVNEAYETLMRRKRKKSRPSNQSSEV